MRSGKSSGKLDMQVNENQTLGKTDGKPYGWAGKVGKCWEIRGDSVIVSVKRTTTER